jgi:prevent-host-death family protein
MSWQLQEAKQRFSELIRSVEERGPQIVTRRGEEIAAVIEIAEYRRLKGETQDFKEFLRSAPDTELDIERLDEHSRAIDLDIA